MAKKGIVETRYINPRGVDLPEGMEWGVSNGNRAIITDPAVFYPALMRKLGVSDITQSRLEAARIVVTRWISTHLKHIEGQMRIKILKNPEWRLDRFRPGTGITMPLKRHYYVELFGYDGYDDDVRKAIAVEQAKLMEKK